MPQAKEIAKRGEKFGFKPLGTTKLIETPVTKAAYTAGAGVSEVGQFMVAGKAASTILGGIGKLGQYAN